MKHDLNRNLQWRAKRLYALFACLVLTLPFAVVPAFAADDPLSVVTSLSDFIFSLIRAVGLILLGYGILQVGLSLQSHDPSQRSNGILTIAGGIVITFTKEILTSPGDNKRPGTQMRSRPLIFTKCFDSSAAHRGCAGSAPFVLRWYKRPDNSPR